MADRLHVDPNLAEMPDFASEDFHLIRATLSNSLNITNDEATTSLQGSWTAGNNRKKERWQQQLQADQLEEDARRAAAEEEEAQQLQIERDAEDQARRQRDQEAEEERREKERKKPKLNPMIRNKPVSTTSITQPSAYARERLKQRKYVELYYFTIEGCEEAARYDHTIAKDTFTISTIDDIMSLKPTNSLRSRNIIPDEKLTFSQMTVAKNLLLSHMSNQGWDYDLTLSLAEFFIKLEAHAKRRIPGGEAALLLYQAEVRREWHAALSGPDPNAMFDISFINEERLNLTLMDFHTRESSDISRRYVPLPLITQLPLFSLRYTPPPFFRSTLSPCHDILLCP